MLGKRYIRDLTTSLCKDIFYLRKSSRPKKILFDHLPKCAGSSLNSFLKSHFPNRLIFCTDGYHNAESVELFKSYPEPKRHSFALITGHRTNELIFCASPECIKITVLRDPVERIISHYYYAKSNTFHYLYDTIHKHKISLKEYARSGLSEELQNWYVIHFSGLSHLDIQKQPEEAIKIAYNEIENRYDCVGFLDKIDVFVKDLKRKANLTKEFGNFRENTTKGKPTVSTIPADVIQTIEIENKLDIALYNMIKSRIAY